MNTQNTKPAEGSDALDQDWANLAKRLLGAMSIGIRIERDSGHLWIIEDPEADGTLHLTSQVMDWLRVKQYGSFRAALDSIDEALARTTPAQSSLLARFHAMDNYGDLGFVFGHGPQ